jgi:cell division protease FtsH
LAERLLDKEVIFKEDLEKIFGKRPFDKDFDKQGQEEVATEKLTPEETAKGNK